MDTATYVLRPILTGTEQYSMDNGAFRGPDLLGGASERFRLSVLSEAIPF